MLLRRFVVSAVTVLLGALLSALAITAIFLGVEDTVPYLRFWITFALPFALIFFGLWCTAMMLAGLAKRFGVEVKMLRHMVTSIVSVSLVTIPFFGFALILSLSSGYIEMVMVIVGLHALISGAVIGWCGCRLEARWQISIPAGIVGATLGIFAMLVWMQYVEPALFQCTPYVNCCPPYVNCPANYRPILLIVVTIPMLGCGFHSLVWLVGHLVSQTRRNTVQS